jgi:hypothetical protein
MPRYERQRTLSWISSIQPTPLKLRIFNSPYYCYPIYAHIPKWSLSSLGFPLKVLFASLRAYCKSHPSNPSLMAPVMLRESYKSSSFSFSTFLILQLLFLLCVKMFFPAFSFLNILHVWTKLNSVAVVRKRTIPTERPPLVSEVSANLYG